MLYSFIRNINTGVYVSCAALLNLILSSAEICSSLPLTVTIEWNEAEIFVNKNIYLFFPLLPCGRLCFGSATIAKGRYIHTVHMNHINLTGISGQKSKLINLKRLKL